MSLDPTRPPGDDRPPDLPPTARHLRGSFIGMAGLAAVAFLVLASAGFLSLWWVLALSAAWLVALVVAVRAFMTDPRRVLLAPTMVFFAWVLAVSLSV